MSYSKGYSEWVRKYNPKKGDRMRVTKVTKNFEGDWENVWNNKMRGAVRKTVILQEVNSSRKGILAQSEEEFWSYFFPYFVLVPESVARCADDCIDWKKVQRLLEV